MACIGLYLDQFQTCSLAGELAGEVFISDLELSPIVHPMVYLEGTESGDFWGFG